MSSPKLRVQHPSSVFIVESRIQTFHDVSAAHSFLIFLMSFLVYEDRSASPHDASGTLRDNWVFLDTSCIPRTVRHHDRQSSYCLSQKVLK